MAPDRVKEAVSALSEDLPARVLFAALAENVAELAALVARLGYSDLPRNSSAASGPSRRTSGPWPACARPLPPSRTGNRASKKCPSSRRAAPR